MNKIIERKLKVFQCAGVKAVSNVSVIKIIKQIGLDCQEHETTRTKVERNDPESAFRMKLFEIDEKVRQEYNENFNKGKPSVFIPIEKITIPEGGYHNLISEMNFIIDEDDLIDLGPPRFYQKRAFREKKT